MSASEKLATLEAEMFTTLNGQRVPMPGMEPAAEWLAESALPQIRALVEAAELALNQEWKNFAEFGRPEDGDVAPNSSLAHSKVARALAALDEALGEQA